MELPELKPAPARIIHQTCRGQANRCAGGPSVAGRKVGNRTGRNPSLTRQGRAALRVSLAIIASVALVSSETANAAQGLVPGFDAVVVLARKFMDNEDPAAREEILRKIGGWNQRLDEIAVALRPVPHVSAPKGYLAADKFTVPRLREKLAALVPGRGPVPASRTVAAKPGDVFFEEYVNYVFVPHNYRPDKPTGMLIYLHGGGGETHPQYVLQSVFPPPTAPRAMDRYGVADLCRESGLITVAPSTPGHQAENKFSFPESETHINAVIEEYSTRYAIDPNRVYIMGLSMGGIGAFHHALRQPDRYAVVAPFAGTWTGAYWPILRGTNFFVSGGGMDGFDRRGTRGGTPVEYERLACQCLAGHGIPFLDAEAPGGHEAFGHRPQHELLFDLLPRHVRDPYARRVCAVGPSPLLWKSPRWLPQPYNRWVSVTEIGPGGILADHCASIIPDKSVVLSRVMIPAGAADAENLGENRFRVTVSNVKKFRLWLHAGMGVDFAKPLHVQIVKMAVDPKTKQEIETGQTQMVQKAKPSLEAMLRYLGDRRDYGLVYHALLEIAVPDLPVPVSRPASNSFCGHR